MEKRVEKGKGGEKGEGEKGVKRRKGEVKKGAKKKGSEEKKRGEEKKKGGAKKKKKGRRKKKGAKKKKGGGEEKKGGGEEKKRGEEKGAKGIFKDVRFYPTRFFVNFGPTPLFQLLEALFCRRGARNLEFLPHPKCWPFLGRPLKDLLELFQIFGPAPSPHTVSIVSCVFLCVLLPCSLTIFSVFRCLGVQVFRC